MALTSLAPGCLPQPPTSHLCQVLAQLQGCLCFSVGFPTRLGVWSAGLGPAEGVQLGLGNWCQLLRGELVGTSCAAWQAGSGVGPELGLGTRPWLPRGAPGCGVGGLDAQLLEVGFYASEGNICWTEI